MREADRIGALAVRGDVHESRGPRGGRPANRRGIRRHRHPRLELRRPAARTGDRRAPSRPSRKPSSSSSHRRFDSWRSACRTSCKAQAGGSCVFTSVAAHEPSTHLALSNAVRPGVTGWAKTLCPRARPARASRSTASLPAESTPRVSHSFIRRPDRGRPAGDSGRSLGRRRRSSATSRASSPPTAPATSPARPWWSTAASREASSSRHGSPHSPSGWQQPASCCWPWCWSSS